MTEIAEKHPKNFHRARKIPHKKFVKGIQLNSKEFHNSSRLKFFFSHYFSHFSSNPAKQKRERTPPIPRRKK